VNEIEDVRNMAQAEPDPATAKSTGGGGCCSSECCAKTEATHE
jgi:hypothetical protein